MPEFRIQRCLGRGGFGEVYKAVMSRGSGVEVDVAIKVLRSDLDPSSQGIQRLRDEGRLLGRMTHPTILRVYDLVVIEGHAALVSEYVAGDDLARILKEEAIPPRAGYELVSQVAAALDAAWSHPSVSDGKALHLVHRDIKPDNIRIDPFGGVKLLDFGIAQASRVRREAHTSVNTIMGSTQYLSPERLVQQEVGPESDVFALGCTAFETLTGEALFARKSMRQMYLLMIDEERFVTFVNERVTTHAHRLGGEAGVALLRAMTAWTKTDRPTAAEVAARCDTISDAMVGPTLRSWCRTRKWSPPPEMTGPLEGLTFVTTLSGGSALPPTATARHKAPSSEPDLDTTPQPTAGHRHHPQDAPTVQAPAPSLADLETPGPPPPRGPVTLRPAADVLPPAPISGPSPWTPEERDALVSGRVPAFEAVPAPVVPSPVAEAPPAPPPAAEPRSGGSASEEVPSESTDPAADGVPDLAEPHGTHRLPVLERQRSPQLWPLPMVIHSVEPPDQVPTSPVSPTAPTAEVTVRLKRVPRKRADGTTSPRRRLTRTASGETIREETKELRLDGIADGLGEPTVRVLTRSTRDEDTLPGREPTWPGETDDPTTDGGRTPGAANAPERAELDEVPERHPADAEELLEAMEATTGSRELPSGVHASRPPPEPPTVPMTRTAPIAPAAPPPVPASGADPTLNLDQLDDPEGTAPPVPLDAPTAPVDGASPPERTGGEARPRSAGVTAYSGLVASAGGLVALLGGVLVLLILLLVLWIWNG